MFRPAASDFDRALDRIWSVHPFSHSNDVTSGILHTTFLSRQYPEDLSFYRSNTAVCIDERHTRPCPLWRCGDPSCTTTGPDIVHEKICKEYFPHGTLYSPSLVSLSIDYRGIKPLSDPWAVLQTDWTIKAIEVTKLIAMTRSCSSKLGSGLPFCETRKDLYPLGSAAPNASIKCLTGSQCGMEWYFQPLRL